MKNTDPIGDFFEFLQANGHEPEWISRRGRGSYIGDEREGTVASLRCSGGPIGRIRLHYSTVATEFGGHEGREVQSSATLCGLTYTIEPQWGLLSIKGIHTIYMKNGDLVPGELYSGFHLPAPHPTWTGNDMGLGILDRLNAVAAASSARRQSFPGS